MTTTTFPTGRAAAFAAEIRQAQAQALATPGKVQHLRHDDDAGKRWDVMVSVRSARSMPPPLRAECRGVQAWHASAHSHEGGVSFLTDDWTADQVATVDGLLMAVLWHVGSPVSPPSRAIVGPLSRSMLRELTPAETRAVEGPDVNAGDCVERVRLALAERTANARDVHELRDLAACPLCAKLVVRLPSGVFGGLGLFPCVVDPDLPARSTIARLAGVSAGVVSRICAKTLGVEHDCLTGPTH
jgi:hypothetical protein